MVIGMRSITLDLAPPPEPLIDKGDLRLQDLEWKPKTISGRHLLIVPGDNEPSKRVRDRAKDLNKEGLRVDFVSDIARVSVTDREKLGLKDRDLSGAPYVYYFDENGALLCTQSGYDPNLLNRLTNTRSGNNR